MKKQPAAKKLPVVPVKKGTAQASCCHTPPVAAAACLTHTGQSVLFIIRPLTSPHNTPGARLQTRGGEEGGAEKYGAGAPTLFPLPCYHPTRLMHGAARIGPISAPAPISKHVELPLVNKCFSLHIYISDTSTTDPGLTGSRLP